MAENKKSFLLYCDLIHTIEKLSEEEAGYLFKHILRYVNDLNPEPPDKTTDLLFEGIKQQLKRDLKKYESIVERNRKNGAKGGRPKKNPTEPTKPNGLIGNPKKPKKADSDTDNDNDTETDNDNDIKQLIDLSELTQDQLYFEQQVVKIAKISFIEFQELANTFWIVSGYEDEPPETLKDLRLHFLRWLRIEKEKSSAKKEKGKQTVDEAKEQLERLNKKLRQENNG